MAARKDRKIGLDPNLETYSCRSDFSRPYKRIALSWTKIPRMPRKPAQDSSPVADFESSLDALEQLVEKMEHGQMSLEQSLAAYERGVGLYRRCQSALEQAELRVRLLSDPRDPDSAEAFPAADHPVDTPSIPTNE